MEIGRIQNQKLSLFFLFGQGGKKSSLIALTVAKLESPYQEQTFERQTLSHQRQTRHSLHMSLFTAVVCI